MNSISIVIVDDHALLRSGLVAMLAYEDDIEVLGEAANGREGLEIYERLQPDILVMDVTMPEMCGIEASRRLLASHPDARILLMTQHEEQQFVEAMLEVDVSGCIGKRAAGAEFVTALRTVMNGEFYLHPAMARTVVQHQRRKFVSPKVTLTKRETEVLKEIVDGKMNKEIAYTLGLSIKTVEWHRSNLASKLGTHGTAELVKYAIDNNLVSPSSQTELKPIDRL
jgi:DNA-binding NarL/FixJ family response regulator